MHLPGRAFNQEDTFHGHMHLKTPSHLWDSGMLHLDMLLTRNGTRSALIPDFLSICSSSGTDSPYETVIC